MALDREQLRNARLIYSVGRAMGMSNRDIQIGLITAMQESGLRNLDYGDRDSLGLFQQRPSQGWGTPQQVTDPVYAAKKFFTELGKVDGRLKMSMTQAAQAVQRSAYPDAYAKHIGTIRNVWPTIADGRSSKIDSRMGFPETPDGLPSMDSVMGQLGEQLPYEGLPPMNSIVGAVTSPVAAAPDVVNPNPLMGLDNEDTLPIIGPSSWEVVKEQTGIRGPDGVDWDIPYGTPKLDQWRKAVVEIARSAMGTPYVWGGNDLQAGVDCSGLVQQVFERVGIKLPRVSFQQASAGKRIPLAKLQPGDLVAWNNSTRNPGADHIAIYIGGGIIVEAPRPGLNVRARKLGKDESAWGVRLKRR